MTTTMTQNQQTVTIANIITDADTQVRATMREAIVKEYARLMDAGQGFPPIVVFFDGEKYYLADGFHRLQAAEQLGKDQIEAEVREGGCRDALFFAAAANSDHGLRRSNDDKRRAVKVLLDDPEWSEMSDNRIAAHCGVTQPFVSKLHKEGQEDDVNSNEHEAEEGGYNGYTPSGPSKSKARVPSKETPNDPSAAERRISSPEETSQKDDDESDFEREADVVQDKIVRECLVIQDVVQEVIDAANESKAEHYVLESFLEIVSESKFDLEKVIENLDPENE